MKQTFEQSVKEIAKIFGIDENSLSLLSSFFLKIKIKPDSQTFNTFRKQNKNVDNDFEKGGNTTKYLTIYQAAKEMRAAKQINDILLKYNISQESFVNSILTFAKSFFNIQSTFEQAFNLAVENFFQQAEAKRILSSSPNLFFKTALMFFDSTKTGKEADIQPKIITSEQFNKAVNKTFEQSNTEAEAERMMREADESIKTEAEAEAERMMREADESIKTEAEAERMMREADDEIKREVEKTKDKKKTEQKKEDNGTITDKFKRWFANAENMGKGAKVLQFSFTIIILYIAYKTLNKK